MRCFGREAGVILKVVLPGKAENLLEITCVCVCVCGNGRLMLCIFLGMVMK